MWAREASEGSIMGFETGATRARGMETEREGGRQRERDRGRQRETDMLTGFKIWRFAFPGKYFLLTESVLQVQQCKYFYLSTVYLQICLYIYLIYPSIYLPIYISICVFVYLAYVCTLACMHACTHGSSSAGGEDRRG